jgi:hypothetical protein
MAEGAFQTKAIAHIRSRGGYVVNQWGSPLARAGVPDLLCGFRGFFVAFELKHPEGPLDPGPLCRRNDRFAEPAQQRHIARIREAGCIAFVVNNLRQVDAVLDMVEKYGTADIAATR